MTEDPKSKLPHLSIPYDGQFPLIGLIDSRVWATLSGSEVKVLAVIWRWCVQYPGTMRKAD